MRLIERDAVQAPRLAATVMLLRDGTDGLEVFMIVRHHRSDVHAGALVFPGGRMDPEDHRLALDPAVFPPQDGTDETMAALRVAAVRETFEECGVLLARTRGEAALVSTARLCAFEAAHRSAMMRGGGAFGEVLAAQNLALAAEAMVYFAHWITPERASKRFDTHFFLAAAPAHQVALHDGHEAVDSIWIAPATALERAAAGTYHLRFPTQMNLRKLGRHRTAAEAMDAARASRVVTVMTKSEKTRDGQRMLRIPLEAGYGGELFEAPPSAASPGWSPSRAGTGW
jgi:8-oxo-dGTP pyrophosphatase MutT (NUDIX family)